MFKLFNKNKSNLNLKYIDDILDMKIIKDLRNDSNEKIYAVLLKKDEFNDKHFEPIECFLYGSGDENRIFEETFKPELVPEVSKTLDADAIVMIHNHPMVNNTKSFAYPSKEDVKSTYVVGNQWLSEGCFLLDHIIVTEDEHYSFVENDLIRIFE